MDRLLTVREASAALGVSKSWLDQRRARKEAPAYIKIGSCVKYREADLRDFIERNLVKAA